MSEQELFDMGQNFIRTQLATIQGASVPLPYGGKFRQVMVDLNADQLTSKGLSASAVSSARTEPPIRTRSPSSATSRTSGR